MTKATRKWVWRIIQAIILLPAASGTLLAQHAEAPLTIDQAIAAALSNNATLRIASLDEQAARSRYKETEGAFLPQAGLSYSAMTTNNPLNAFGFKLQQKTIAQADFEPASLNHPGGTPDFMTSLDVQQPLFNLDRIYQRKGAFSEVEIYQLKTQRTREEVVYQTRKAYLQLQLSILSQKVMEDALASASSLYRYTNDRVGQGLLSPSDALNVQVEVATMESRLAEARSRIRDASDQLGLLMGRSAGEIYAIDSIERFDRHPDHSTGVTEDHFFLEHRADFAAMRKAIESSDWMLKSSKMASLPRLNAIGSYQLNDSRMFGFAAGSYLAGIRLSWDLFKGNSIRNRNRTLLLEKQKLQETYTSYKKQREAELMAVRRKLTDASIGIRQQQAAVDAARESYRILRDRYEQGLCGSTDILLAQTQLSQQRMALAQAFFELHVTEAYLDFLTPTTVSDLAISTGTPGLSISKTKK